MKKMIFAALSACLTCVATFGQYPEPHKQFLDADPLSEDTVFFIAEIRVADHLVPKSRGSYRNRLIGSYDYYWWPRKKREALVQPHLFYEFHGFVPHYAGIKAGGGLTHRRHRISVGVFGGKYGNRDDENYDYKFRSKGFQEGSLYGVYVYFDPRVVSVFGMIAWEKRRINYRGHFSLNAGTIMGFTGKLSGFRVYSEFETLLGMTAGLMLQTRNVGLSLAYIVPDRHDLLEKKGYGQPRGEGFLVRVDVRMF